MNHFLTMNVMGIIKHEKIMVSNSKGIDPYVNLFVRVNTNYVDNSNIAKFSYRMINVRLYGNAYKWYINKYNDVNKTSVHEIIQSFNAWFNPEHNYVVIRETGELLIINPQYLEMQNGY